MESKAENKHLIPLTVLTGYLGAGKTTLLNHILSKPEGKRYAVIVNEYGEIGIDNDLIVHADEEVLEMNNGCICCNIRGDLIRILGGLLKRKGRFDAILIETTGLANPAPVIQTFFTDEELKGQVKLDAIITVADAKWLEKRLKDAREAKNQIAFADVILLNKIDLVSQEQADQIEQQIRGINPYVEIYKTTKCDVLPSKLLERNAFDLDRILTLDPNFLAKEQGDQSHNHKHNHAHHHSHSHEDDVYAISLSYDGEMDPHRFLSWMNNLMVEKGMDILRSKGIIAFKNEPKRYVFQAVHMMVDGDVQRDWQPEEKRTSKLVFIGRDLDKQALEKAFLACAIKP